MPRARRKRDALIAVPVNIDDLDAVDKFDWPQLDRRLAGPRSSVGWEIGKPTSSELIQYAYGAACGGPKGHCSNYRRAARLLLCFLLLFLTAPIVASLLAIIASVVASLHPARLGISARDGQYRRRCCDACRSRQSYKREQHSARHSLESNVCTHSNLPSAPVRLHLDSNGTLRVRFDPSRLQTGSDAARLLRLCVGDLCPGAIWIKCRHQPGYLAGTSAEIFLEHVPSVIDQERHHAGVAVLRRIGDQREAPRSSCLWRRS